MLHYLPSMPLMAGHLYSREGYIRPTRASIRSIIRRQASPEEAETEEDEEKEALDLDFGRASAETGVIIITLSLVGLLLFCLFILYKKKGSGGVNPLAWWRNRGVKPAPSKTDGPDLATTRGLAPDGESFDESLNDEKFNHGHQDLAHPGDIDIEKGPARDMPDENLPDHDQMLQPPHSATGRSIHTQSSMTLPQQGGQIVPQYYSAFSESTTEPPTPAPAHLDLKENPLPPLPFHARNAARDTMLTTISEDSEPTRHRNINSWVSNMQTRQDRRELHRQNSRAETASISEGAHPAETAGFDGNLARLSDMSGGSTMKTPSLRTAQMAWPVRNDSGKVRVAGVARSGSQPLHQNVGEETQKNHEDLQENSLAQYQHEGTNDYSQHGTNPFETEDPHHSETSTLPDSKYEPAHEYPRIEQDHNSYPQDSYGTEQQGSQQYHEQPQETNYPPNGHHPQISIQSPSVASTIPEDDWIPPVTRYRYESGSTLSRSSSSATTREAAAVAPAAEARKMAADRNARAADNQSRSRDGSAQRQGRGKGKSGRGRRR